MGVGAVWQVKFGPTVTNNALTWLHMRRSREMTVAFVILVLESSSSLHPHNMDVTSVEMQQGELSAPAIMS